VIANKRVKKILGTDGGDGDKNSNNTIPVKGM
jgi:hypothetical protein